jgi:toxin ParE1/3/4
MSITYRPQAVADIDDIADYLEQQRTGYGARFHQALSATLAILESQPGLGASVTASHPALAGLRQSLVQGFRNYLIFYLPVTGGIEVVRVLYGARDLPTLLNHGSGPNGTS